MAFTLRQIEIFVEAAKDENFRKTADRLDISQPSVSKHIALFEKEVGGKLFYRQRGSSAQLSPLGQKMLIEAKSMLRSADKVRDNDQDRGANEITLKIAAGHYLLDHWLRPRLRRLYAESSTTSIEFLEATDREHVLELVLNGSADYGFYTGRLPESSEFETYNLCSATVGLYSSPQLAKNAKLIPEDLVSLPFVLPNKNSAAEVWQKRTLATISLEPRNIAGRSQYMEIVLELVLGGTGVAILFDDDAAPYVAQGRLVRFPVEFEQGQRCMVSRTAKQPHFRKEQAIKSVSRLLTSQQD